MASMKMLAVAGSAVLYSLGAASAADMPMLMQRPVVHDFSGWYLRGDVGMTNQRVKNLDNLLYHNGAYDSVTTVHKGFDSGVLFGLGVGYQVNSWVRTDVTGEYRGGTTFHGLDLARVGGAQLDDNYTARKSEWLALANVYFDLGTWWSITPFIGAGVGFSHVTMSDFRDIAAINAGGGYAAAASKFNLAWAVHAGLAYRVTPAFTVELAYRYVDLGHGTTGDIINFDGTNNWVNPMEFKNLSSHDMKLGVRWMIMPEPVYAPPLITKG